MFASVNGLIRCLLGAQRPKQRDRHRRPKTKRERRATLKIFCSSLSSSSNVVLCVLRVVLIVRCVLFVRCLPPPTRWRPHSMRRATLRISASCPSLCPFRPLCRLLRALLPPPPLPLPLPLFFVILCALLSAVLFVASPYVPRSSGGRFLICRSQIHTLKRPKRTRRHTRVAEAGLNRPGVRRRPREGCGRVEERGGRRVARRNPLVHTIHASTQQGEPADEEIC